MAQLTPEQRSERSRKAAITRRNNKIAAENRANEQQTDSSRNRNWLPWVLLAAFVIGMLLWHPWTMSAPAAPAIPVPTEVPTEAPTAAPVVQPTEAPLVEAVFSCPNTTEEAKNLFGIDVQRIATEACAWVWRGKPLHTLAVCPVGYICTFDALNDITVVHYGIGQSTDIYAGTWRLVSAYPPGDKVYDICALYQAEKQFGQQEVPPFEVRYQGVPGLEPQTCPAQ